MDSGHSGKYLKLKNGIHVPTLIRGILLRSKIWLYPFHIAILPGINPRHYFKPFCYIFSTSNRPYLSYFTELCRGPRTGVPVILYNDPIFGTKYECNKIHKRKLTTLISQFWCNITDCIHWQRSNVILLYYGHLYHLHLKLYYISVCVSMHTHAEYNCKISNIMFLWS